MRINQFLSRGTALSRRKADEAIQEGRVEINGILAKFGDIVVDADQVTLDGEKVAAPEKMITIMLHKPVGYVVSKAGQGSKTIYDILPPDYHHLNPIGRLDKDSSGLLLLTNDGDLHHQSAHPSFKKEKIYEVVLNKPLDVLDHDHIQHKGVKLPDGLSRMNLAPMDQSDQKWLITIQEGRNRQIRRTFAALGYKVTALHRTHFGEHALDGLQPNAYKIV